MRILTALLLVLNLFASDGNDGGNGGSGEEVTLLQVQSNLNEISGKIFNFFLTQEEAREAFPEINFDEFLALQNEITIIAVNQVLIDKNGMERTCLNFEESKLIQCNLQFADLNSNVPAQFVLLFHEILGVLGIEESSPQNLNLIESYPISSRLNHFISIQREYVLRINSDPCLDVQTYEDAQLCLAKMAEEDPNQGHNQNYGFISDSSNGHIRNVLRSLNVEPGNYDFYGIYISPTSEYDYWYVGLTKGNNYQLNRLAWGNAPNYSVDAPPENHIEANYIYVRRTTLFIDEAFVLFYEWLLDGY